MAYKKTAHRRHRVRSSRRKNVKSRKVMRGGEYGKIDYNGGTYIGHIWNNKPHGNGTWRDDTGVYYDGEWLLGKKNGFGKMEYPNNTKYEGKLMNNERHGIGSMYYDNGKVATGRWRNDEAIGKFIIKWPKKDDILPDYIIVDGSDLDGFVYYDGEVLLGKKNGFGKMEYPNNTIYEGRWKNNKRHGIGSMYYNSGKVATGRWRNDEPIGEFTMKWPKKDNILPDYIIVDASDLDGFEFDDEASEYGTEFDV